MSVSTYISLTMYIHGVVKLFISQVLKCLSNAEPFPILQGGQPGNGAELTAVFVINPQPKPVVLEATVQWHSCYSQGNLKLRRELSTMSVSSYSVDSSVSYSQHKKSTSLSILHTHYCVC